MVKYLNPFQFDMFHSKASVALLVLAIILGVNKVYRTKLLKRFQVDIIATEHFSQVLVLKINAPAVFEDSRMYMEPEGIYYGALDDEQLINMKKLITKLSKIEYENLLPEFEDLCDVLDYLKKYQYKLECA